MKKLLFIFLLTLNISLLKSQNSNVDYDGSVNLVEGNLDVYIGQEFILMFDNSEMYIYGSPLLKNYKKSEKKKSNIYLPYIQSEILRKWETNYNSLVGKHFKVLSIKEIEKRNEVEKYFELLLIETNEVFFYKIRRTTSNLFFPFFVVKHLEYLKQTFINKKFLGADLGAQDDDFDTKYPEIAKTMAKAYGSHEPHPDKGQTKLLFSKASDITWDSKDIWVCKDIKLDFKKNPLIFVLSNNNQDVNLSLGNIYSFFFENKRIAFCDLYCEKDFVYKIYDYTPKPTPCCDSKDRLNCYKDKIKEWASIPANQLRKQKYDPNFNFNDFEIVTYDGSSFILKDDKDTLCSVWYPNLKEILSEESYRRLDELEYYFYDEAFKTAKENNKIMQIVDISKSTNSARGVSFSIEWFYYNTNKKIKYIYFTVVPYNAVGDRQYCDIRNYSKFTGSATGPITADARPKEYNWKNAWYNGDINNLKIEKVEIEYLDGTSYTFVKELNKIISPASPFNSIYFDY